MALDFQQVSEQIQKLGEKAHMRAQRLNELRQGAFELLHNSSQDMESLAQKVGRIVRNYDPNLRCALPSMGLGESPEPLDGHYPLPSLPGQATILAVDGSQIAPDRHAAAYFALINVGAIQMSHESPEPAQTTTLSQLFYDEELFDLSDASLNLERDLSERTMLAELAEGVPAPVITFTDGPLELWGAKAAESGSEFHESLDAYLEALQRLKELQVITAGYVDKPAANLIVRLLEIADLPEGKLAEVKGYYPLRGVTDVELYRQLLEPGERSALFAMQSRSARSYRAELALHFFYLNVGRPGNPWLARVEIPAWVAQDREMLEDLHATLVRQCQIMGSRAYPYLLHRAHEAALVSLEERKQVTQMIVKELRLRGLEVGETSHKQHLKDLPGRTKY